MNSLIIPLGQDSVDVPELRRIYANRHGEPVFIDDCILALDQMDSELAWRAAWLLLHAAREGVLRDQGVVRIGMIADGIENWVARLNLCQLFSVTGCPVTARETVFPFLVSCFEDRRLFIKAWALAAIVRFYEDPEYSREVSAIIKKAKAHPSKSMGARVRALKLTT